MAYLPMTSAQSDLLPCADNVNAHNSLVCFISVGDHLNARVHFCVCMLLISAGDARKMGFRDLLKNNNSNNKKTECLISHHTSLDVIGASVEKLEDRVFLKQILHRQQTL